jgi:ATP-dependent DNA helicase RecG
MASSLQTLIKILRLEQQKGHQNKAVIGGFARFAYHWSREAHSQALTDDHHDLVDRIVERLRDYEQAESEDRPAILDEIIAMATGQIQVTDEEEVILPPPPLPEIPAGDADDIGIGLVDESEEEEEEEDTTLLEETRDMVTEEELFETFGTFQADTVPARSVRERRGYSWRQDVPAEQAALSELRQPVITVQGVGETRAEQLERLGVQTVHDLLLLMPRRHDDYSRMKPIHKLAPGEVVTVVGVIERVSSQDTRSGGTRVEAYVSDGSGNLRLNWFNQPWMQQQLQQGEPYVVSGRVEQYLGRLVMNTPELEPVDRESLHAGRIVPVYPLTKGLGSRTVRNLVKSIVDRWTPYLPDYLPLEVRESADLMDYGDAIAQAHFPDNQEDLAAAKYRLAFDELFVLQVAMLRRRYEWQSRSGLPLSVTDEWVARFESTLPYAFTGAQRRAIDDIRRDISLDIPMNRLLQGDVGSGKTVIAALAAGIAVDNGAQAAIMAPTSILAEQHFTILSETLRRALGDQLSIALLTSHISPIEREAVYAGLADGSIQVVVGTHALIQPDVAFSRLGVAVIDEQHRFGVAQRGALREKAAGGNPHLLVMTATPIPRTLALTLHADLDLTVIDEMPPGRTPVQTRVLQATERERAYAFIHRQIEQGRQAYIICPLVEDSDKLDARSAVAEYERLQNSVYTDLRLGLIHGRMNADEKETAMNAFYAGETHILVSTTVIEVGIDVPNATVILIENANRFGLAQLHQLRGRVGRGSDQSYCLLLSDGTFLDTDERLRAVEETSDGFRLAEIDWKLRGAGDLLGTRQSGYAAIQYADLINPQLIEQVQREAHAVYTRDPELAAPEHQALKEMVDDLISRQGSGDVS